MMASRYDASRQPPLVVHLIYRLDFGGLETLLVDTINRMPAERYRHAVVCLAGYTEFAGKITRPGVELFDLGKRPGLSLSTHADFFKLMRRLKPAILHTYNLSAIEYAATAALAGVPVRIHAEHGRDAGDPQGRNRKHNLLRRLLAPVVDCYVPVSGDLRRWFRDVVGIPEAKNLLINNGVDTAKFSAPRAGAPQEAWNAQAGNFVIGTVGRLQAVKDQVTLVDAFAALRAHLPQHAARLRLVIVGEGPMRPALEARIAAAGLGDAVFMPGARNDIARLMQTFSVFALSSIAEGTPVTLLEAMATGLPVVSTAVGGIPALVADGATGMLAPAGDAQALARAFAAYVENESLAAQHGAAGRARVENEYSIVTMLSAYMALYDTLCKNKINLNEVIKPCAE